MPQLLKYITFVQRVRWRKKEFHWHTCTVMPHYQLTVTSNLFPSNDRKIDKDCACEKVENKDELELCQWLGVGNFLLTDKIGTIDYSLQGFLVSYICLLYYKNKNHLQNSFNFLHCPIFKLLFFFIKLFFLNVWFARKKIHKMCLI